MGQAAIEKAERPDVFELQGHEHAQQSGRCSDGGSSDGGSSDDGPSTLHGAHRGLDAEGVVMAEVGDIWRARAIADDEGAGIKSICTGEGGEWRRADTGSRANIVIGIGRGARNWGGVEQAALEYSNLRRLFFRPPSMRALASSMRSTAVWPRSSRTGHLSLWRRRYPEGRRWTHPERIHNPRRRIVLSSSYSGPHASLIISYLSSARSMMPMGTILYGESGCLEQRNFSTSFTDPPPLSSMASIQISSLGTLEGHSRTPAAACWFTYF